jgi:DNA polymerase
MAQPGPDQPLSLVAEQSQFCRRCDLWRDATQTVFGEGPTDAVIMLVGEQPGVREDLVGRPFVGPAGQLLDAALREAGIERTGVYVTNAVKHFKFTARGKRRIHGTPSMSEIKAYGWWLDQERARLRPRVIVLLGASAARAVLGRAVTIGSVRGKRIALGGIAALVTVHPSWLLRLPDPVAKARERERFVADLREAAEIAREGK